VLALVVAVVAFIALKPADDSIPRDSYTVAADQICLDAKTQILAVEGKARAGATAALARELVPIVATWRAGFEGLEAPTDRADLAQDLEAALLEAEAKIAGLGRVADQSDKREIVVSAEEADAASAKVEEAVASLGLSECAAAAIGLSDDNR
jgi:hypothetical protein